MDFENYKYYDVVENVFFDNENTYYDVAKGVLVYKKENPELGCLNVTLSEGKVYINHSLNKYFVEEDIYTQMLILIKAFKRGHLDRIMVYENQVSFCYEENLYGLVYRTDDNPPNFMSAPTESFEVVYKKIDKHWYYMESK